MATKSPTVTEYLDSIPEDRRAELKAVRAMMKKSLDPGYSEGIGYGMILWSVPHSTYPAGYHCDPKLPLGFAALGAQKNYLVLHLMPLYSPGADPASDAARLHDWFHKEWAKTGKKLDMGKACIRFRKADDLALDVIAKTVAKVPVSKWIAQNEKYAAMRKAAKKASHKK